MEKYRGMMSVRLHYAGTKSEGRYAFLLCDGAAEPLQVCREGSAPFNDPLFEPFDGVEVTVTGTVSHGWLIAETIEPAPEPEAEPAHEPEKEQEA